MKKRDLMIGAYLIISLMLVCAEYTGDSIAIMLLYYTIVLLNFGNAVRVANKH